MTRRNDCYSRDFASVSPIALGLCLCLASAIIAPASAQDSTAAADHAIVEALLRLPKMELLAESKQRDVVRRYLSRNVGTERYFLVAEHLGVHDQTDELVTMLTETPFSNLAIDAAKLLQQAGQFDAVATALHSEEPEKAAVVARALGYAWHPKTFPLLKEIVEEPGRPRQVRIAAADALGRSQPGQQFLLGLAVDGKIADDIRFVVTDCLMGSSNEKIVVQAKKLLPPLASAQSEDIPPINQLAKLRGDPELGKVVFNTIGTCSKCHKVLGAGKEVGPDLSEIGSKLSREDMYVAIMNPSAAVSHNFETYTLLDANDKVVNGLLINQTEESVTVRDAEGVDHSVAATDVVGLKKQSISLMPADLQKAMSLQNLVDLVDYLVILRKQDDRGSNAVAKTIEIDDSHDPQRAIAGFQIADGIDVQLFASEPQLLSPTSIDVDSKGRIWVCEAVNYRHFRNPDNQERSEGDRILVLEDTDNDGQADKRTVFFQDPLIDSPHGVCVIGSEIIVSAGENVIVFSDANDDLIPDSRRILFSGISGVQHDHGIHAFGVGPDGKLYFNFGNEGKQLRTADGETVVDRAGNVVDDSRNPYQQGMVFRCNPDGSDLETLGWNFRNNWEVCVDSFGTMWQSDNDDDGNRGTRINFVMEFGNYGYRDELTGATWKTSRIGLEQEIPLQHWHLNDPGVVPNILQTGAGSPTGICFYEGNLLPEPFQNQIIHTDPGPNVVRAYPVSNDGAGYKASIRNLVKGVNDPWFRPVDVCAAPDGSLFVADWYDPGVGGHRMGDSKHGRIFRIVPKGHAGYEVPSLDLTSIDGTMRALQSPNLATRYLAQQRIGEMGLDAVDTLKDFCQSNAPENMKARALWQLSLVDSDPRAAIELATESSNADLRIVGVRIARQQQHDVLGLVESMVDDPSAHVRRELAISLRGQESPKAAELWAQLAMQHDGQDRWYLEALGIAADSQWDPFFDAWLNLVGDNWNTPAGRDIVWRCRSAKACAYLAEIIKDCDTVDEQLRFFRAFDFHEGETKIEALRDLTTAAK